MDEKIYAKDLSACPTVFCATRDDQAPLFTADAVIDRSIKKISLEDYKGKWVILFFYPSDFTFV
jgi:alkyl hydroperoxide reductase subunit AhpC